jgi:serine/threonine-protein kinase
MEYVEGVTLREYLQDPAKQPSQRGFVGEKPVTFDEALRISIDVAAALNAAHEANVVHRDIKPENIIIGRKNSIVKVLDFGLGKLINQPLGRPSASTVLQLTRPWRHGGHRLLHVP